MCLCITGPERTCSKVLGGWEGAGLRLWETGMRQWMNLKLQCLVPTAGSAQNTPWLQRFLFTTHGSFTVICILMRVSVFLPDPVLSKKVFSLSFLAMYLL